MVSFIFKIRFLFSTPTLWFQWNLYLFNIIMTIPKPPSSLKDEKSVSDLVLYVLNHIWLVPFSAIKLSILTTSQTASYNL